jgi:FkbM family methyltransferase
MPGISTFPTALKDVRGRGRRAVARLARRVLPRTSVTLAHVEPGLTLKVNLRRHVMFWSGGLSRFEPYTVSALRAAVRPGDTVFDVGGNIGFFSTLLSRLVGPAGRVLTFEPEPENLELLRANLDRNACRNVTIHAVALGASAGTAMFSLDDSTGSTGHLGGELTAGELAVGTGKVRLIETQVETIDRMAARAGVLADVIKMDIEGGEINALEGASAVLDDHRPILLSELTGPTGADVVRLLDGDGYRMWDLETGRPAAPGDHPFMIAAIPVERVEGERGVSLLAAIGAERP